jgi:hypothetical protein
MKKIVVLMALVVTILAGSAEGKGQEMHEMELSGSVKEVVQITGDSKFVTKFSIEGLKVEAIMESPRVSARTIYDEKEREIQKEFDIFTVVSSYNDEKRTFQRKVRKLVDEYGKLDEHGNVVVTYKVMFDGKGPSMLWHGAEYDENGNKVANFLYGKKETEFEYKTVTAFDESNRKISSVTVLEDGKIPEKPAKSSYSYNAQGFVEKVVAENYFDTPKTTRIYTYENIDTHGNWLKRVGKVEETGEETITIREITYYE